MNQPIANADIWNLDADGARVGCTYTARRFSGPDDVAAHFGLRRLGAKWIRLSRDEARAVLRNLLSEDLAHGSARLAADKVEEVIAAFLGRFHDDAVFYSNGRWMDEPTYDPVLKASYPPQSESATSATFDGGIVVWSEVFSGVLWIEDED